MIALVICDRATRERSNKTIHVSVVVTLLLKRRLHIRNYLVWWHAIVSVDGSIPCIIRAGIVTPGGKPITGVPIVRSTEREHDVITVMTVPPVLIVPLWLVVAKHCVLLALPVLASLDPSSLLEFYGRRFRSVRLFWKIEVLRLDCLVLNELSFYRVLVRSSSLPLRLVRLDRFISFISLASIRCVGCLSSIRSFDCLSLSVGLVLLALLDLISSIESLSWLRFLPLIYCS